MGLLVAQGAEVVGAAGDEDAPGAARHVGLATAGPEGGGQDAEQLAGEALAADRGEVDEDLVQAVVDDQGAILLHAADHFVGGQPRVGLATPPVRAQSGVDDALQLGCALASLTDGAKVQIDWQWHGSIGCAGPQQLLREGHGGRGLADAVVAQQRAAGLAVRVAGPLHEKIDRVAALAGGFSGDWFNRLFVRGADPAVSVDVSDVPQAKCDAVVQKVLDRIR